MQRQTTSYKGLVHPKNQKKYRESRTISNGSKYTSTGLVLLIILLAILCIFPFLYLKDWIKIVSG